MSGEKRSLVLMAMVLALAGCASWIHIKVGPPKEVTIEATPERLARGKYLVTHVTDCVGCHSERDWTKYAAPIIPGTEGKGGELFDKNMGLPGELYARNITPAGIGEWTDGEVFRTLTTGVNKSGKALFPLMPYQRLAQASQEDINSIIVYIRTLQPVKNQVKERHLDFPLNHIVRTIPTEYAPKPMPKPSDTLAYGAYMTNMAGCIDCHTILKRGKPTKGMEFAGGFKFKFPWGTVQSANITPDSVTGIGQRSKDNFISLFRAFASPEAKEMTMPEGIRNANTVMPWTDFAGMTDEDLGAIYTYLRSQKPIKHQVAKYPE